MNHLGPRPLPSAWNYRWARQWLPALLFIQRFRGTTQMLWQCCAGRAEEYSSAIRCNCKSQLVPDSSWDCTAECRSGISALPGQSFHSIPRYKVLTTQYLSGLQRKIRRSFSKRDTFCSPSLKMRNTTHRGALLACEPPKLCSTGHAHRSCIWSTEL